MAENTDRIPSTKWLDGDIQSLLNKIKKLEMDNIELKMMIANMQSFVASKLSDFTVFISDNIKPIHHVRVRLCKQLEFNSSLFSSRMRFGEGSP